MALLEVTDLCAGYNAADVLHGVTFAVEQGGITAILGANGAGKTTLLRAVSGMLRRRGSIRFDGQSIVGLPPKTSRGSALPTCPTAAVPSST
jgi:branched-chain amino acid transport system ATP-binding protein